jgi:plastocyanin
MRTGRAALAGVALAVALGTVGVACSDEGTDATGAPFEVPGTPVATTNVDLPRSYRFEPAAIEVAAGSAVTWTNRDDFPHNVTLLDGSERTADLPIGGSASIAFEQTGTVYYECSIHPQQMHGMIVVG